MEYPKLRVLVLSHISDMLGGAERSMLDVFDYWSKNYNIEPEFIMRLPIKGLADELNRRGWKYHALDYTFWSNANPLTDPDDIYLDWQRNTGAVKAIEKIISKMQPDVVFTNSVVAPWAALAAWNKNVPHVWFVREYGDLDHGRTYLLGRQKTLADVGNLSNLVITISEALEKHLSKYINKSKLTVLYNPFNVEAIRKRALQRVNSPFKSKSSLKLVITGNVAVSKGQFEAIKAVARLVKKGGEVELCIVGKKAEPDFQAELDNFIISNKIDHCIHFVGRQDNPLAYVNLADVGIMSSRMEGFGRVTFEYLAIGKPVIGANSGATPEMVVNGKNGYLFEAGDVNGLADAIDRYVKDRQLLKSHGKESLKKSAFMMSGDYNIDAAYHRMSEAIGKSVERTSKINMLEYWGDYAKTAKSFKRTSSGPTLTRLRRRLRNHAKRGLIKLRAVKTKVVKK